MSPAGITLSMVKWGFECPQRNSEKLSNLPNVAKLMVSSFKPRSPSAFSHVSEWHHPLSSCSNQKSDTIFKPSLCFTPLSALSSSDKDSQKEAVGCLSSDYFPSQQREPSFKGILLDSVTLLLKTHRWFPSVSEEGWAKMELRFLPAHPSL